MEFGKVAEPEKVDFNLPQDHAGTKEVLERSASSGPFEAYVGCAKWNRSDLRNFYPRGVKDELRYYATQFNAIELNATFYKMPDWKQVETWKQKTPEGFKFCPKLNRLISHYKRLLDVEQAVDQFCDAISAFEDRLGMAFLQLHDNFQPKNFSRLEKMLRDFPKGIPLGVELRNAAWFGDKENSKAYTDLLAACGMANIIVDTAGRRDLLHMHLSSPVAFIRFVGANNLLDQQRLEDWVERLASWKSQGLQKVYFFLHQHKEESSPRLAAHFNRLMNERLGLSLRIPPIPEGGLGERKLLK